MWAREVKCHLFIPSSLQVTSYVLGTGICMKNKRGKRIENNLMEVGRYVDKQP